MEVGVGVCRVGCGSHEGICILLSVCVMKNKTVGPPPAKLSKNQACDRVFVLRISPCIPGGVRATDPASRATQQMAGREDLLSPPCGHQGSGRSSGLRKVSGEFSTGSELPGSFLGPSAATPPLLSARPHGGPKPYYGELRGPSPAPLRTNT